MKKNSCVHILDVVMLSMKEPSAAYLFLNISSLPFLFAKSTRNSVFIDSHHITIRQRNFFETKTYDPKEGMQHKIKKKWILKIYNV